VRREIDRWVNRFPAFVTTDRTMTYAMPDLAAVKPRRMPSWLVTTGLALLIAVFFLGGSVPPAA